MLLYFIVSKILTRTSLVGLAVGWSERFRLVSMRSVPVAVGLSVMLNATAVKVVSIVKGGNIEERELLNEE